MQFVYFLKSLVLPSRMVKYRHMSIFIAILIFVLSTYLLAIPYGKFMENDAYKYKDNYNMLVLQQIPENDVEILAILTEISNLECTVNEKSELACNNLVDEFFEREISYVKDGITKNILFVIDLKDDTTYDLSKPFDLDDRPYVDNNEHYFLILTKTIIYYQAHQKGIETQDAVHNGITLSIFGFTFMYETYLPEFTIVVDNPQLLPMKIVDQLLTGFAKSQSGIAFLMTMIITIIFPLFMVLVFWMLFRRRGRLTRFKEYYNISAIVSLVPLALTFALSWVLPEILNYYIYIFAIYNVFILYRINNGPDLI